jgi:phytoene synthase
MTSDLAASYVECQRLARRTARNFYYSFLVLPRAKRRAMCALYAFLRHTDDLGDSDEPVEARRAALASWRDALRAALAGEFRSPLLPALADSMARFRIPPRYLHDAIDGVESDLDERRFETFEELAEYCHRVASAVGLACVHIWGFRSEEAFEPARSCGIAFQLTNILRDLPEDSARGRVYLPQEDLRRFAYSDEDLARGTCSESFRALMRFEIGRAEEYYRQAAALPQWLTPEGRAALGAMTGIYRGLLDEIKRRDGDVFAQRVRLSSWRKAGIAAKWFLARPMAFWSTSPCEANGR